ncbi:MAG TPA: segregation/condensation protein A [Candidatus Binatia bacterium]|nr:segregation/condensation protein A [Candidatus Binatia bacterium]
MNEARLDDPGGAADLAVRVGDFSGSLEQLVLAAQRGDIDLRQLSVTQVTAQVSRQIARHESGGDLRQAAEGLSLLARLLSIKAAHVTGDAVPPEEADVPVDDPEAGRRLAEYRIFRAAMETLLLEPAELGTRSFLSLISAEVLPLERLRIAPDRLAAAFRQVLERLADQAPLPVGMITFSVEEKADWLRGLLAAGAVDFEAIFSGVESRLEAVACFLGLLNLLGRGEAIVDQPEPFGPIRVSAGV